MKAILGLFLVYIFFDLGLIAIEVGIGFLLRWMLPSVDLGTTILFAVVATGFSLHYFIRLLWFLDSPRYEDDDNLPPVRVYPLR